MSSDSTRLNLSRRFSMLRLPMAEDGTPHARNLHRRAAMVVLERELRAIRRIVEQERTEKRKFSLCAKCIGVYSAEDPRAPQTRRKGSALCGTRRLLLPASMRFETHPRADARWQQRLRSGHQQPRRCRRSIRKQDHRFLMQSSGTARTQGGPLACGPARHPRTQTTRRRR
jgi:hypothetical protein